MIVLEALYEFLLILFIVMLIITALKIGADSIDNFRNRSKAKASEDPAETCEITGNINRISSGAMSGNAVYFVRLKNNFSDTFVINTQTAQAALSKEGDLVKIQATKKDELWIVDWFENVFLTGSDNPTPYQTEQSVFTLNSKSKV